MSAGLDAVLSKRLEQFTLDLALSCPPGALLALVGPSGSGKTTVLRLLAGLAQPDSGRIRLGGACWLDTSRRRRLSPQARCVGLLSQDAALFPHMTLARNVAFAAAEGVDAEAILERLGIAHLKDKRPAAVSGGERQRAALAQVLARRPRLLLLDEPFSALDLENRLALRRELLELKAAWNIPMVHVTHDLADALALADDIVALNRGRRDDDWLTRQRRSLAEEQGLLRRFALGADDGRPEISTPAH